MVRGKSKIQNSIYTIIKQRKPKNPKFMQMGERNAERNAEKLRLIQCRTVGNF